MKILINVRLKDSVLDPQGSAVKEALNRAGYGFIKDVRQNKVFEIEVSDGAPHSELKELADKFLSNPIIEEFKIIQ
jgi:phosphoribosylformylglycinamidine synthase